MTEAVAVLARHGRSFRLAGRFLVYVPGGRSAGISRKLPAPERKRLKGILERVIPGDGGAIIRTAFEALADEPVTAAAAMAEHLRAARDEVLAVLRGGD